MIFEAAIPVQSESDEYGRTVSIHVDIFEHAPSVIDVTTPDGGASMSVDEVKELIAALQKAVETIEGNTNATP